VRRHHIRSGKALDDPNDRLLTFEGTETHVGKPKESRRGRPAIGRDPVVAVRLPHETITEGGRSLGQDARAFVTIGGGPLHDHAFSCVH
jgi:hypothetical protein